MDTAITIISIGTLVAVAISSLGQLFFIGKRQVYTHTAGEYLFFLLQNMCVAFLAGRCLGWW